MKIIVGCIAVLILLSGCSNEIDRYSYEEGILDGRMEMFEQLTFCDNEERHRIDVTIEIGHRTSVPDVIEQSILSMKDIDLVNVKTTEVEARIEIIDGKVILIVDSIKLGIDVIDIAGL